jgi:hypothetical protein
MKAHLTGLSAALLLLTVASTLPSRAEEAAQPSAPAATPSTPAATPSDTPAPTAVPRPSIVPKNAEPAQQPIAPQADDNAAPRRHRHYAHRRRYYGWHYAYWQPFPIYWPHLAHNRIYWSRIPWFF